MAHLRAHAQRSPPPPTGPNPTLFMKFGGPYNCIFLKLTCDIGAAIRGPAPTVPTGCCAVLAGCTLWIHIPERITQFSLHIDLYRSLKKGGGAHFKVILKKKEGSFYHRSIIFNGKVLTYPRAPLYTLKLWIERNTLTLLY